MKLVFKNTLLVILFIAPCVQAMNREAANESGLWHGIKNVGNFICAHKKASIAAVALVGVLAFMRKAPMSTEASKKTAAETIECGKCKRRREIASFVVCCKKCQAKMCSDCDIRVALTRKLFLDTAADYFFVQEPCFRCHDMVKLYGALSTTRQFILMDRANEEHEAFERVFCGGRGGNSIYGEDE